MPMWVHSAARAWGSVHVAWQPVAQLVQPMLHVATTGAASRAYVSMRLGN